MFIFGKLAVVVFALGVAAHAGDGVPPGGKEPANDNKPPEADIIDLGARRMQKYYAPFVEMLEAMRAAAPPVDHSDWYRGNAKRSLESRFEDLAGRRGPAPFAAIRKTLDALDGKATFPVTDYAKLGAADRALVVEGFLREALWRAQGPFKTKDVAAVARHVVSPLMYLELFELAFDRAKSVAQVLDLYAVAISSKTLAAEPPVKTYEQIFHEAFNRVVELETALLSEAGFLETFLRTHVLNRAKTSYDRALVLRSLEPILTARFDSQVIRALSDIARAEWLPGATASTAARLLRRWQFSGRAGERGLGQVIERELSPLLPATKAPLRVCMGLLLGR